MKSLADRVSAALKHAGISQADLARACKISAVSVNNCLTDKRQSTHRIPPKRRYFLGEILGLPIDLCFRFA